MEDDREHEMTIDAVRNDIAHLLHQAGHKVTHSSGPMIHVDHAEHGPHALTIRSLAEHANENPIEKLQQHATTMSSKAPKVGPTRRPGAMGVGETQRSG
jgi:hypothetical protein